MLENYKTQLLSVTFFSAMLTLSFTLFHVKLPSFILKFPHNPDPISNPIPIPNTPRLSRTINSFKLGHQKKSHPSNFQIGVVFAVRGTMKSRHTESDSGKDLIWVESGGAEREND